MTKIGCNNFMKVKHAIMQRLDILRNLDTVIIGCNYEDKFNLHRFGSTLEILTF